MDIQIPDLDPSTPAAESDIYVVTQLTETATRKQTLTKLRQAIGANIVALFGLTGANDRLPWFTGVGSMALATFTPAARALLDDVDSVAMRATLGVQNVSPDYIEGLQLQWVSANAITTRSGGAYLNGQMVNVPTIAKTGLTMSAATWYHCYLYLNAGVPDVEFATTAPTAPYYGTARNKTGDTTRRYLGSVLTAGANTIIRFKQAGTRVSWLADYSAAPFAVLANGVSTTSAAVSLAAAVPVTATHGRMVSSNTSSAVGATLYMNDADLGAVTLTNSQLIVGIVQQSALDFSLSSSQTLNYAYLSTAPGGSGAYMRVFGYLFER